MAPVDWRQAWKTGVTPWDAGASPPALRGLLDRGAVPGGRVLVPGCGTGYDLATLAREDREVVGIDLSDDARTAFLAEHPSLPGSVVYEVTDFFSYAPARGFDFVWDYTFFCALDPDQRSAWSQTMKRLVEPAGVLATLLFPFEDPISDRAGPSVAHQHRDGAHLRRRCIRRARHRRGGAHAPGARRQRASSAVAASRALIEVG